MSEKAARCLGTMFQRISIAINAEKDRLSELDGAIGDADHGITMALGFMAVNAELAKLDLAQALPSEIFSVAASAFLDAVGASTGPLYATAFRRASQALTTDQSLSPACQAMIVDEMRAGIQQRGKGQRGDKTMLDAWVPAAEAAINARAHSNDVTAMWNAILEAAETGANSTSSMIAARGRAARLGERSLGHIDPGAASAVIILRAMRDTFVGGNVDG
ncbi:dihydroxyacetone kinase subunit L [Agrobacterium rhizogenes]|uniref:Dihydroxyacetone kinase subunit DhaL n=2 Tax=unclassified Rhizobium TaxID=2613769 RepID=A0AAU7SJG4_9HYPH|nr:dihydroxyacetone kinase subunit L [Rhizobium rhizogenes]NTJ76470.1 dihydroxyacetone kinase subunit L [Rhizobium rhizogenes]